MLEQINALKFVFSFFTLVFLVFKRLQTPPSKLFGYCISFTVHTFTVQRRGLVNGQLLRSQKVRKESAGSSVWV